MGELLLSEVSRRAIATAKQWQQHNRPAAALHAIHAALALNSTDKKLTDLGAELALQAARAEANQMEQNRTVLAELQKAKDELAAMKEKMKALRALQPQQMSPSFHKAKA